MASEIERLVVRHRDVAPMLSVLLAGTQASVVIRDPDGNVVLHREGREPADPLEGPFPIVGDGRTIGTIEGGHLARPIASVLSYAVSRELDKRALAREALDRYRELNLIYDLAGSLGTDLEVIAIARSAVAEAGRLPAGGQAFLLMLDGGDVLRCPDGLDAGPITEARPGEGVVGRIVASGAAELVNMPATDDTATPVERSFAAILCAPMRAHGRTVGVLGVASTDVVEYRAGDLKVVEAIAALAAPALDHALLHEAAVRELEELRRDPDDAAG